MKNVHCLSANLICISLLSQLIKESYVQALIQYPDPGSATNAKVALEGHAIYDGGYNRVRPCSIYNVFEKFGTHRLVLSAVAGELFSESHIMQHIGECFG